MVFAVSFAVSFAAVFYTVGINQLDNPGQTWMWQKMNIAPYQGSHTSVATFTFPKANPNRSLRLVTTDTPGINVSIIGLILGEGSLFLSFNWTGSGNWTLRFGMQT
jgi:hypothetical protein